ncbi:MAG: ABC transporter substrate-binding protein [Bdellovibrionaceae bacterium]|jgi:microcin C transport system substrate-binding protein|nr:ABC transporter substrate-binding protein [Pseudobdellovibrionaceae bacterium]
MKKLILTAVIFFTAQLFAETLPKGLKWETNNSDSVYASPNAKKGGTFRLYMKSFPMTLRTVGPDSNGSFRGFILDNYMGLTEIHPNSKKIIPSLATHWSYAKNNTTVYYKLDPSAKWSDGKPITADDYLFTLDFMRSKHIVAPWYNNNYTKEYDKIIKYDDYTIAIVGSKKRTPYELQLANGMTPFPKHAIKLDKNFVKNYNWKIIPNSGPYLISKVKKGKSVTFKRNKNWWAKDLRYVKNRYNVDKILVKVIRDDNVAFEHFRKGSIDIYGLTIPKDWHDKSKVKEVEKGYIQKLWFYTDSPLPTYGIWLNTDKPIFKDINVRKAFAHAMNIEKVNKTILRGDYERLHTSYTGNGKFTNTKLRAREFDLKKVDKYMKLAGWDKRGPDGIRLKKGQRMSIELLTGYSHHRDRITVVKEEAKKAGIELVLKEMDGATAFKSTLEKQHTAVWQGWSTSIIPGFWQGYHSDNAHKPQTNNISNTDNKKIDSLIMKYRNTFNWNTKQSLSRDILRAIYDEAVMIPTFKIDYYRVGFWRYMKFPKVPGTKLSRSTFEAFGERPWGTGGLFWIDKDIKKETLTAKKAGKSFKPVTLIDKSLRAKN